MNITGNVTQTGDGSNIIAEGNVNINVDKRKSKTKMELQTNIINFYETKEIQYNQYINNIYKDIDKIEIPSKEIYEKKLDNWLTGWRKLDEHSQKYLISEEYIYESLLKTEDIDDYSPFVLQFCRVIENQISIVMKGIETTYDNQNLDANTSNQQFNEMQSNSLSGDPKGGISDLINFCKNDNDFRNKRLNFKKQIMILKGLSETHQMNWSLIQLINNYLDLIFDRNTILVLSYIQKLDDMRSKVNLKIGLKVRQS